MGFRNGYLQGCFLGVLWPLPWSLLQSAVWCLRFGTLGFTDFDPKIWNLYSTGMKPKGMELQNKLAYEKQQNRTQSDNCP